MRERLSDNPLAEITAQHDDLGTSCAAHQRALASCAPLKIFIIIFIVDLLKIFFLAFAVPFFPLQIFSFFFDFPQSTLTIYCFRQRACNRFYASSRGVHCLLGRLPFCYAQNVTFRLERPSLSQHCTKSLCRATWESHRCQFAIFVEFLFQSY